MQEEIDFDRNMWQSHCMARISYTTLRDDYPEDANPEYRTSGQFKSSLSDTITKISDELDKLDVSAAVIELDVSSNELRRIKREGFPRWHDEQSPCVRLTFSHPELGPLQYPCGTYYCQKHNLRAIALTLEALRAIDRYGACSGSQQYEGFKGLPPGEEQERYFANSLEAAEYVAELAGKSASSAEAILDDREYFTFCYKSAAKSAHPDSGGSDKKFQTLQQAKELIDGHFCGQQEHVA